MAVYTSLECSLPRPDIAALHAAVSNELSKRLLGGAPVIPLSTEDVLAFIMAGTLNLMWGFVTQAVKEQDPANACCDNLVILAARRGVNLQGATRAKGYIAVTGDPGAAIPPTLRFIWATREYKLDVGAAFNPTRLSASGGAVLRIVSVLPGGAFNISPGATVTLGAVVTGIDGTATVIGNGLTGGNDQEDCEALRRRVIAAEHTDVLVVNEEWFIRETLRYPGVTRVCVDACQGCCDPTYETIYPFMEGVYGDVTEPPYGVPPCEVLDAMNEWMFGHNVGRGEGLAPVGIRGAYMAALPTPINVTAQCARNCPTNAQELIENELWDVIRYTLCVGSTICRDQLRAAIYRALGSTACMSNIQFTFGDGVRFSDEANTYLDCGHFPVLGTIELRPGL